MPTKLNKIGKRFTTLIDNVIVTALRVEEATAGGESLEGDIARQRAEKAKHDLVRSIALLELQVTQARKMTRMMAAEGRRLRRVVPV